MLGTLSTKACSLRQSLALEPRAHPMTGPAWRLALGMPHPPDIDTGSREPNPRLHAPYMSSQCFNCRASSLPSAIFSYKQQEHVCLQYATILLFQALRHVELGPLSSFPQQEGTFPHTHVMTLIGMFFPDTVFLGPPVLTLSSKSLGWSTAGLEGSVSISGPTLPLKDLYSPEKLLGT